MTLAISDAAMALTEFQRFRLVSNGQSIDAFQRLSLERSLDQAVSKAKIEIANAWRHIGQQAPQIQLAPGARVQVLTDLGTEILTGFVDHRIDRGTANDMAVSLDLASWTAQAADNSVELDGYQLKDVAFSTACQTLCNQSQVRVAFGPGVRTGEILQKVQVQPGETAIAVIEKLCRKRGYTLTDRANGTLVVIGGALQGTASFACPGNIRTFEVNGNLRDQYSECVIIGSQNSLATGDEPDTISVVGRATMNLALNRRLLIQAKGELNASLANARAQQELRRRVANAQKISVKCPALRLVEVGMRASVRLDPISLDVTYIVESVKWSLVQGELTTVGLVPYGAYAPIPPVLMARPEPTTETVGREYIQDGPASE